MRDDLLRALVTLAFILVTTMMLMLGHAGAEREAARVEAAEATRATLAAG
jgi:hypothetical protein